jgi:adenylate kinase family enzyme
MKPRLILMCGLPASGKTTLANRLADEISVIRLCTDEWQSALQVDLKEGDYYSETFHGLLEAQLWIHAKISSGMVRASSLKRDFGCGESETRSDVKRGSLA